jgi:hypothetical protein
MRGRNSTRLGWCRPVMLFEEADMKYIVESRSGW